MDWTPQHLPTGCGSARNPQRKQDKPQTLRRPHGRCSPERGGGQPSEVLHAQGNLARKKAWRLLPACSASGKFLCSKCPGCSGQEELAYLRRFLSTAHSRKAWGRTVPFLQAPRSLEHQDSPERLDETNKTRTCSLPIPETHERAVAVLHRCTVIAQVHLPSERVPECIGRYWLGRMRKIGWTAATAHNHVLQASRSK